MTGVSILLAVAATLVLATASALVWGWWIRHRSTGYPAYIDGLYAAGSALKAVADAIGGDWYAIVWAVLAVMFGIYWWYQRRGRKRRRADLALGAKSRQLRAALVRRMRQSRRPSPVLRPSLRGVS